MAAKNNLEPGDIRPLTLCVTIEEWPRTTPVRITGHTWDSLHALVVTLENDGHVGRGEACGVYYRDDDVLSMCGQIDALRPAIERGLNRALLQNMLPPGGARNALDCALWDLEAKITETPGWRLAGLDRPRSLLTTFTCHADDPDKVAARALGYASARAIKLKLLGDELDKHRVVAVRQALPDVWLGVDANQGFTRKQLEQILPVLVEARVSLIEQPFSITQDHLLDGFASPIPIAADESVQGLAGITDLLGRFNVVNIKLDKCGGLSEGLAMARKAHAHGLTPMVGNMGGTSLAMAPAFLVGQLCSIVDLDGPIFLKSDRDNPVQYAEGRVTCPEALWGGVSLRRGPS